MDSPRPLIEHLIELRRRLVYCVVLFLCVFAVCYIYSETLFQVIVKPLADVFLLNGKSGHRLIYTGLSEAFTTYLKVSAFYAFIITFPFTAMQAWLFMAPGLYKNERRLFSILLILTPLLFLVGAAFAYFVVFPMVYNFFLSFETAGSDIIPPIQLEARMGEYLSFVMRLILAFGKLMQKKLLMMNCKINCKVLLLLPMKYGLSQLMI